VGEVADGYFTVFKKCSDEAQPAWIGQEPEGENEPL
jgi:hypothetical protein